jgi:hypothetical protein
VSVVADIPTNPFAFESVENDVCRRWDEQTWEVYRIRDWETPQSLTAELLLKMTDTTHVPYFWFFQPPQYSVYLVQVLVFFQSLFLSLSLSVWMYVCRSVLSILARSFALLCLPVCLYLSVVFQPFFNFAALF